MTGRVRYEIERFGGGQPAIGVSVVIDHQPFPEDIAVWAQAIVDRALTEAVEATGLHSDDIVGAWTAMLVERISDQPAYVREAQRRGVLAL